MARNGMTMTVAQVCAELRSRGIPCNNRRVADNIESGAWNFGRLVNKGPTGTRCFEIWRKDFENWMDKQCQETGQHIHACGYENQAAPPTELETHATQVIQWASICSNPLHKEVDCQFCPYRTRGLCMDALIADAGSVLLAYINTTDSTIKRRCLPTPPQVPKMENI